MCADWFAHLGEDSTASIIGASYSLELFWKLQNGIRMIYRSYPHNRKSAFDDTTGYWSKHQSNLRITFDKDLWASKLTTGDIFHMVFLFKWMFWLYWPRSKLNRAEESMAQCPPIEHRVSGHGHCFFPKTGLDMLFSKKRRRPKICSDASGPDAKNRFLDAKNRVLDASTCWLHMPKPKKGAGNFLGFWLYNFGGWRQAMLHFSPSNKMSFHSFGMESFLEARMYRRALTTPASSHTSPHSMRR